MTNPGPTRSGSLFGDIVGVAEDISARAAARSEQQRQQAREEALLGLETQRVKTGIRQAATGETNAATSRLNLDLSTTIHEDLLKKQQRDAIHDANEVKLLQAAEAAAAAKEARDLELDQFHVANARDPQASPESKRISEGWMASRNISPGFLEDEDSLGGTVNTAAASAANTRNLRTLDGLSADAFDSILDTQSIPGANIAAAGPLGNPNLPTIDFDQVLEDESVVVDMARAYFEAFRTTTAFLDLELEPGEAFRRILDSFNDAVDRRRALVEDPGGAPAFGTSRPRGSSDNPEPISRGTPRAAEAGSTSEQMQINAIIERTLGSGGFYT